MKKMLSLAAMLAVISYATPASAELKIGGDAATRVRSEFNDTKVSNVKTSTEDLKFQYKIRLKASADLGSGYFFKTLVQNEDTPGIWTTVASGNTEIYRLDVSNFYFGRMMEESHYMIGRLPLNSFNNPIFDLAYYAVPSGGTVLPTTGTLNGITAVDVPVATYNNDRVFGLNYGTKIGSGELSATLVVANNNIATGDSHLEGDGLFNDGYLLHVAYKTTIGDVTVEPQAVISLTDVQSVFTAYNVTASAQGGISPNVFGANATIPAGGSKIGLSAFYTVCEDTDPNGERGKVDYSGYLLRLKGESGPVMAWIDYSKTEDNSVNRVADSYNNLFVWAQYNVKVHESATGTFSVTPTIRYRASGMDLAGAKTDFDQLRGELYATVTF
jgi:hypothetical protein